MKVPRFLFEDEDLRRLQRISGPLKLSDKWVNLTDGDLRGVRVLLESESPLASADRRRFWYKIMMAGNVVALHEKVETLEQRAMVLTVIMALSHIDRDLPIQLMELLEG